MMNDNAFLEVKRRERKKIEQRRVLLSVARALFEKKGYENTIIDEIAESADVSRGTFFNYFPNKESILNALFEEAVQDLRYYLGHDLKDVSSSVEKIYRFFHFWVGDTIGYKNVVGRILINRMTFNQEIYDSALLLCCDLVKEGQKTNEISKSRDPMDIANLLAGIYYSIIINAPADDENIYHLVNEMLDIVFRGIAGPGYARPGLDFTAYR